jgi:hypothetical protein
MSDSATGNSAIVAKKPRQGRSPGFPFIPLSKALERVETFRIAEGGRPKHFAPLTSAAKAWGIGPKTGQALQTIAALGQFGLIEFEGMAEARSLRPSDVALRILLDKQLNSPEREELIQRLALKPKIHKELWEKWGENFPSDPTFETYLVRDRGFSESGARDLIAEYKDTISFAKLGQPAIITPIKELEGAVIPPPRDEAKIDDLVQVEINGAFQLAQPVRVRAIQYHEGQKWVFVEGRETGIPMDQIVLQAKGVPSAVGTATPPRLAEEKPLLKPGLKEEKNSLDEGEAILVLPDSLSAESVRDLEYWLKGILRKEWRRAGLPTTFTATQKAKLIELGIKAEKLEGPISSKDMVALSILVDEDL